MTANTIEFDSYDQNRNGRVGDMVSQALYAETSSRLHSRNSDSYNQLDLRTAQNTIDTHFGTPRISDVYEKVRNPRTAADEAGTDARATVEKKYGVKVEVKDGRYNYVLKANGENKILLTTDASAAGILEAKKALDKLVAERTKQIEDKYGVNIKKQGEPGGREEIFDPRKGTMKKGSMLAARQPTLTELEAVKAALEKAGASSRTNDSRKPLTFAFFDKPMQRMVSTKPEKSEKARNGQKSENGQEKDEGPYAQYDDRTRTIRLFPKSKDLPPTEKDATRSGIKKTGEKDEVTSLEEVLSHELAHNGQHNTGTIGEHGPDRKTMEQLGWATRVESKHYNTFELRARDGYQYTPVGGKDGIEWLRRNKEGKFVDKNGVTSDDPAKAHRLSNGEMRDQALTPPVTNYFVNPVEMMAEAMTQYRLGNERRTDLRKSSPQLHDVIAKHDQTEIDKIHGRNSDGTSKLIRMPDGRLAANTEENRRKVSAFESL